MQVSKITGCILGTAAGDALGLPYEGMSRRRAARMLGKPDRHRLIPGKGMVSDDTEHTCMVAQSLIASGGDAEIFKRDLAWRLRFWLLALPPGIGLATLKSILRLWLGFKPDKSGSYSAGNGPAMRSAIIGATIDDTDQLKALVKASTRMTHIDPKAEYGALAVALAARMARNNGIISGPDYMLELNAQLEPEADEFISLINTVVTSIENNESTTDFAESMGLSSGVTGYIYHTAPIAIHAWLSHQDDYRSAIISIIECGGDTDTVAAIAGGIIGTAVGREGIPGEWLDNIIEWPRSIQWMEKLAQQLEASTGLKEKQKPAGLPFAVLVVRNLFFMVIVLLHGFRRLLPPY